MSAPPGPAWPSVEVTEDLVRQLVDLGGYTHPLFHPPAGEAAPLPGQAVLLLAGGLAEQSGAVEGAAALLGLEDVRFPTMARPGTRLSVRVTPGEETTTSSGRRIRRYGWTVRDDEGRPVLDAVAVMLMADRGSDTAAPEEAAT